MCLIVGVFQRSRMDPLTRAECEEVLRDIGGGCIERTLDVVLLMLCVASVLGTRHVGPAGMAAAQRRIDALFESYNGATVRSWWHRMRAKGWIGQDLHVTREGRQRIEGCLPSLGWHRKWNGRWYIVSFDVPERGRMFRNQLRETLKRLRFGRLHASTWISATNVLGDVRSALHIADGDRRIIFAITERLGTRDARDLAATIWPLDDLNARYDALRASVSSPRTIVDTAKFVGVFLRILSDDPQLPHALLPRPWYGFSALRTLERVVGPLPIARG